MRLRTILDRRDYDLQVLPQVPTTILITGRFERYNIARNHLRFYNNVGVTASYEMPQKLLTEHGLKALTYLALHRIVDHHPVMSISIVDEVSINPSWVRLPKIDLEKVVRFHKLDERDSGKTVGI